MPPPTLSVLYIYYIRHYLTASRMLTAHPISLLLLRFFPAHYIIRYIRRGDAQTQLSQYYVSYFGSHSLSLSLSFSFSLLIQISDGDGEISKFGTQLCVICSVFIILSYRKENIQRGNNYFDYHPLPA